MYLNHMVSVIGESPNLCKLSHAHLGGVIFSYKMQTPTVEVDWCLHLVTEDYTIT